jgi:hypothetical protein
MGFLLVMMAFTMVLPSEDSWMSSPAVSRRMAVALTAAASEAMEAMNRILKSSRLQESIA